MATVNKNFRIKHGLVVEGSTATVNGQNILTETGGNAYILNLVGGATLVKSVDTGVFNVDGAGNLTVNANTFDSHGSASAAQTAAEGYADSLASNYDPAGSASAAQTAAQGYADGLASNYDPAGSASAAQTAAQGYADGLASNYDPAGSASAAQAAAEATAASALSSAISAEVSNRNTAISTAVDSLVDGAPALLNTLNELAAAINDDANYTTTITTALGTKAPLASPDLTGVPTAPTAAANTNTTQIATTAFAKAEADAAQTAAEGYADSLASNYDAAGAAAAAQTAAEGTAQEALDDVLDGTTSFTAVNVNDLVSQRAAQGVVATAQNGSSMMSWAKSDYGTAKAWVKFATATHSQISEVLLTTDSTGNISITEFGMVGTNGSLGSVGASYLNGNIAIEVDTVHAATTVTVVATLIK
jgi:hypothetical protein